MKQFISITLLSMMLLMVGCVEKGKPRVQHEPATTDKSPQSKPEPAHPESEPSPYVQQWRSQFANSQKPVTEILLPLAQKVLDPKRVADLELSSSRSSLDELIALNQLIVETPLNQQQSNDFKQVLLLYEKAMYLDCESIVRSCLGIRYFSQAYNSVEVVKLLATRDKSRRFQYILYAFTVKNRIWDPQLNEMLMGEAESAYSNKELMAKQAVQAFLETTIQAGQFRTESPEQARKILDLLGAWDLLANGKINLSQTSKDAIITLMTKSNYLYDSAGSLNPGFKKAIDSAKNDPNGIVVKQRAILAAADINIEQLGATKFTQLNGVSFILDSMLSHKLTVQNSADLLGILKIQTEDLEKAFQTYFRSLFVNVNFEAAKLFGDVLKVNYQDQALINHVIPQAASSQVLWTNLKSDASLLRNLAQLVFDRRKDAEASKERLTRFFESTDRTILSIASYPQMLALMSKLTQSVELLRIPGMIGRPSETIIKNILAGLERSFFPYSSERTPLTTFELIYSMDLAIRSGLFNVLGIKVDDLIYSILSKANASNLGNVRSSFSIIKNRFKSSSRRREFINMCREFTENRAIPHSIYFGDTLLTGVYYGEGFLQDIYGSPFSAESQSAEQQGGLAKTGTGINFVDLDFAEAIEKTRLDLGAILRIGDAFMASYTGYLESIGKSTDEISRLTSKTKTYLDYLKSFRLEVLNQSYAWWKPTANCTWHTVRRELETQQLVLDLEMAYLRQVHRDMTRLRQNSDPSLLEQIQRKIRFSGLPSGFAGYDKISADKYIINQVDVAVRLSRYLTRGLTTDTESFGPIAPNINVEYGESLTTDSKVVANSFSATLDYQEDQEAFVNTGLIILLTGTKTTGNQTRAKTARFLAWLSNRSLAFGAFDDSLFVQMELSRLERELTNKQIMFPTSQLLASYDTSLQVMGLTDYERKLFDILGIVRKHDLLRFRNILGTMFENQLTPWGYFDFPMLMSRRDELGLSYRLFLNNSVTLVDELRQVPMATALSYYRGRSNSNRKLMVFPYSTKLDQNLDESVRQFVRGQLGMMLSDAEAIQNRANEVLATSAPSHPLIYLSANIRFGDLVIRPTLIRDFKDDLRIFQNSTAQCFSSDRVCNEFK